MAAKKKSKKAAKRPVNPIPRGYHTVIPTMNQTDAKATIAFCKKAFGAKLRSSMPGPGGKLMHAEIEIDGSVIMLSDAVREPARVSAVMLYVPKVDKTFAKAVAAGATVLSAPETMFWGDRFARITDPFGNLWGIASRVEKVTPVETKKRMKAFVKQMGA
jgi:PhnB protein